MGKKTSLSPATSSKANLTEVGRVEQSLQITNQLGLHARAAASFVKIANRFRSSITVKKDTVAVNGKSIMGVLMLAAPKGTLITLIAEGPDAAAAAVALAQLIHDKFGEE
ncbi:MAG: HPr family phosphocarrier protein [Deltaproteobacteria bacterium]|nr:HPr family phosphocarrier protein [Deltaproteobacteria bacterium]